MTNTNIAIIGLIGIGALIYFTKDTSDQPTITDPEIDPTQSTGGGSTTTPTPYVLNLDLLLAKGSRNPETKELQKLLNVSADGIFGSQTETALYNKKGILKTTLNQYKKTPTTTVAPFKIGDFVQAKKFLGAKVYQDKFVNGQHNNTGVYLDTYFWTENIGKIIAMTPDKQNCVVFAQSLVIGDRNVWVKTEDIELV